MNLYKRFAFVRTFSSFQKILYLEFLHEFKFIYLNSGSYAYLKSFRNCTQIVILMQQLPISFRLKWRPGFRANITWAWPSTESRGTSCANVGQNSAPMTITIGIGAFSTWRRPACQPAEVRVWLRGSTPALLPWWWGHREFFTLENGTLQTKIWLTCESWNSFFEMTVYLTLDEG